MEQVTAHQGQGDLEGDIDAAVGTKSLCLAIQRTWTQFFEFELPYLPQRRVSSFAKALRTTRPTYASPYTEGPAETPGTDSWTPSATCSTSRLGPTRHENWPWGW